MSIKHLSEIASVRISGIIVYSRDMNRAFPCAKFEESLSASKTERKPYSCYRQKHANYFNRFLHIFSISLYNSYRQKNEKVANFISITSTTTLSNNRAKTVQNKWKIAF